MLLTHPITLKGLANSHFTNVPQEYSLPNNMNSCIPLLSKRSSKNLHNHTCTQFLTLTSSTTEYAHQQKTHYRISEQAKTKNVHKLSLVNNVNYS